MFVYNAILSSYIILIDFLRCVESGVSYLSSRVESIVEASNGHSLVACDHGIVIPSRYDGIIIQFKFLVMVYLVFYPLFQTSNAVL